MKITVLGSNGFLSTAISKYANNEGWTLSLYGLDEPVNHRFDRFVHCNFVESELDCDGLLDSDIVVYAIGAGIQSNLKESSDLIYNLNVATPVKICNKLKDLGYNGCFVTFGSVFEMGETGETHFFSEIEVLTSNAPAPSDYVVSKRMLSRFVAGYKHSFTHWHFIIPTIYGEGENPKRLIPYTINAIRNGETLHFTSGNQTRQYLYVGEVPVVLKLAYEKKLPSGVYNIQGKETHTVKEIVELIHKALGKNIPDGCFGTIQRSDECMEFLALDGTNLFKFIGFSPVISIEDAIMRY